MRRRSSVSPTLSTRRTSRSAPQTASKSLMWRGVQNSVPISMGDCMENEESPKALYDNLVAKAREAGYHGPPVIEGHNIPDFLSFQAPRLVQTVHSISDDMAAEDVRDYFGSEWPDLGRGEARTSHPRPNADDLIGRGAQAPDLDANARSRYRSPRNKMTLEGGPARHSKPCTFSRETEPAAAQRRPARPPQSAAKAAAAPSPKRKIGIYEKRWDHAVGMALDYRWMFAAWKGRSWREGGVVVTDVMAEERWFRHAAGAPGEQQRVILRCRGGRERASDSHLLQRYPSTPSAATGARDLRGPPFAGDCAAFVMGGGRPIPTPV